MKLRATERSRRRVRIVDGDIDFGGTLLRRRAACIAVTAVCSWAAAAGTVRAQPDWISGYLLTAPLFSGATLFSPSNASNFNRFRLSVDPAVGPFSFEAAYEHAVTFQQHPAQLGFGPTGLQSGAEWWDLGGTITPSGQRNALWQHRFDRLNIGWNPTGSIEVRVGRQAISWGTTRFLTPADPFVPFIPADPLRLYRAGVDALRVRAYPSPLSEIDFVVRPSRSAAGEEVTALLRGLTTWRNWELSGWGGSLYGDTAGAVGLAGGIGPWAVRAEAVVRDYDGTVIGRGTIGVDRLFLIGSRTLTVFWEYQRDGLGAVSPEDYFRLLLSQEASRGEFQLYGRDETMLSVGYEVSAQWSVSVLALHNLNDRSTLIAPSVGYIAGDSMTVSAGLYVGVGPDVSTPTRPLASEYGFLSPLGFMMVSWFF